jgi:multiple sugar transport system substrate-binding protein
VIGWSLAAWLALLACASCASAPEANATPADLVVAAPRGKISTALEAVAAAYVRAEGTRVRVEALGGEEYAWRVNAALLAGLDRYDLVFLSADELARWAGYHAIQPLAADIDTAPFEPWLPAVRVSGELYGLPTQPDPVVLWYRADLFQAAGLAAPGDWEALRRAAETLDQGPQRFGMVTAGSDIDAGADFAAVLAGFGGQMVGAQYQVEVDGEDARRALEWYAAMSQPGAGSFTRADVLAALRDGRAALGIAPFSAGGTLLDCNASPSVCQEGQPLLAWTRLPGLEARQSVGSLSAWAIPLRAANAGQAQRFAAWLGGEAGARAWAQAGGIPAHAGVLSGLAGENPLRRVSAYQTAFPPVATTDLLWKACNSAVNAAVSGKQPPRRALEAAAAQMQQALRQAGFQTEE